MDWCRNRIEHILNGGSVLLLLVYFVASSMGKFSAISFRASGWTAGMCAGLAVAGIMLRVRAVRCAGVVMFFCGLGAFPLGILSVIAGLRLIRLRNQVVGREPGVRCKRCGYDLRGLIVPRCPECGCLFGFEEPIGAIGLTEQDLESRFHGQEEEEFGRSRKS